MPKLFFASSNQHKIDEIEQLLAASKLPWQLITLRDLPELAIEVVETGDSYQANALQKAQAYAQLVTMPVLTDDSGVEAAAFPDLMGIRSARWFPGSDQDRCLALLERLRTQKDRTLTYHCVLCFLQLGQPPQFFTGELNGQAAHTLSGQAGFGYDPLMIPDGYTQTFAELGQEVKNEISHRRQALDKLVTFLKTNSQ